MYTSGFIFKGCLYDHHSSTLLKRKYFSYCPIRLRMLAGGSTPQWGPG